MPSNSEATSNDAFFDQLFPEKPPVAPTPDAPKSGAIIQTSRTTYRVLDPWTEPLRSGITDPRSDLSGDHLAWIKVLGLAFAVDGQEAEGVYALLHCCRCEGALLDRRRDRFYLVRGEIDATTWGEVYRPKLEGQGEAVRKLLYEAWR